MELKEIKLLIDLMTKNGLTEFELEKGDVKIRLKRGLDSELPAGSLSTPENGRNGLAGVPSSASATVVPAPMTAQNPSSSGEFKEIKSPMVGTFYRSPSPETPPYIEVGQTVKEDTVVCIIEAMKVMNEIKAEVKGVITEILIENAKPVEFGKPLFKVKAA